MLILTRRLGEKIIIGEEVYIQLLDIVGRQIKLGIHAPKEISVHREEIFNKIRKYGLKNKNLQGNS